MRKIIVSEYITLDGIVEAPGGEPGHPHTGWTIPHHSDEMVEFKLAESLDSSALLVGRKTYEGFAEAWPEQTGDFADHLNSIPKYVVSTTKTSAQEWNNSSVISKVPDDVVALKDSDGGNIGVAGSARLVQALLAHGLVDELRLLVFPVILGSGDRLFAGSPDPLKVSLTDVRRFPNDVVLQTYAPTSAG